jgi:hypothetical protein
MGPITLFDKSFLQSLSLDEAVWFDNFYLTNIAPIFYVETLADLEKAVREGRTPEQEVGIIAEKTPEMHSSPNIFHQRMVIANLLGHNVAMDGKIIMAGGRYVETADRKAIIFDLPPEREAFERWQKGDFLDVERLFAKTWRSFLRLSNLSLFQPIFTTSGVLPKCHSLEEAKFVAESIVGLKENQQSLIPLIFELLHIPKEFFPEVYKRFATLNYPSLKEFAPYSTFVLIIEIFFYLAINSELVPRKINSKTDFGYLFYLPFCMVFVSSDKLHRRCAPLFLRQDQEFVWGLDLKDDLKKINIFFDAFPDSEKERGLYAIATYPPDDVGPLTARLWDRFLTKWRIHKNKPPVFRDKESEKKTIEDIKKVAEGKTIDPKEADFDSKSADAMVLKKMVRKKKGKWWQVPKSL